MLNYHPVSSIMTQNVDTIKEVNRVRHVHHLLSNTRHNGFPVVDREGRLRGFILRKTLTTILKLKAFSKPIFSSESEFSNGLGSGGINKNSDKVGMVKLTQSATISHDSLERNYPKYPLIEDIQLSTEDKVISTEFLLIIIINIIIIFIINSNNIIF